MESMLRKELKSWRKSFRDKHGRDPTRSDMQRHPNMGSVYDTWLALQSSASSGSNPKPSSSRTHAHALNHTSFSGRSSEKPSTRSSTKQSARLSTKSSARSPSKSSRPSTYPLPHTPHGAPHGVLAPQSPSDPTDLSFQRLPTPKHPPSPFHRSPHHSPFRSPRSPRPAPPGKWDGALMSYTPRTKARKRLRGEPVPLTPVHKKQRTNPSTEDEVLGPTPPGKDEQVYRPWLGTASLLRSPTVKTSYSATTNDVLVPGARTKNRPREAGLCPLVPGRLSRTRGDQGNDTRPSEATVLKEQVELALEATNEDPTEKPTEVPMEAIVADEKPFDPQGSQIRVLHWSEDEDDLPFHAGSGRRPHPRVTDIKKKVTIQMEPFCPGKRMDQILWDPEDELGLTLGPENPPQSQQNSPASSLRCSQRDNSVNEPEGVQDLLGRLHLASSSPRSKIRSWYRMEEQQCVERLLAPVDPWSLPLDPAAFTPEPPKEKIIAPRKTKPSQRAKLAARVQAEQIEQEPSSEVPSRFFSRAGRVGVADEEDLDYAGDDDWASELEEDEVGWGDGGMDFADVL